MKRSLERICTGLIYLVILFTIALVFSPTGALADYTFAPIDYPGAQWTSLGGINNTGTIVGTCGSNPHQGFSLSGGSYTPLNYPGASTTEAVGINDAGTIVGIGCDASGCHGFSLSGGSYTPLNYPGTQWTEAIGINNAGTIVGLWADVNGGGHSFVLSGGSYTPLNYPGASNTEVTGINNAGTIVGWYIDANVAPAHGFSLSGGSYTPLNYPGAQWTEALGINDAGTIVGEYQDGNGLMHGFLLSGTTYTSLDYPGASATAVGDINNAGTMVGAYIYENVYQSFVATPVPVPELIAIDIKPGSGSNCFNQNGKGVIPVAIFGSANLDVTQIDIDSLSLQGLSVKIAAGKSNKYLAHNEYVNVDNYLDLIVQFQDGDNWIASGNGYATLTGKLMDGTAIEGKDKICIVP